MLAFIDESGDPGFKFEEGSSNYFTLALVVFKDAKEADACAQKIEQLKSLFKKKLLKGLFKKKEASEFRFAKNSNNLRYSFIETVSKYDFFYSAILVDKKRLPLEEYKNKKLFYLEVCRQLIEATKNDLYGMTLVADEFGGPRFENQFEKHLRCLINQDKKILKKARMDKSSTHNLIQLADYIAGITRRPKERKGADPNEFVKPIKNKECVVVRWPQ